MNMVCSKRMINGHSSCVLMVMNVLELRLEEDCRLLDLRSNKIANLEAQLKNIAYGTAKGGQPRQQVTFRDKS